MPKLSYTDAGAGSILLRREGVPPIMIGGTEADRWRKRIDSEGEPGQMREIPIQPSATQMAMAQKVPDSSGNIGVTPDGTKVNLDTGNMMGMTGSANVSNPNSYSSPGRLQEVPAAADASQVAQATKIPYGSMNLGRTPDGSLVNLDSGNLVAKTTPATAEVGPDTAPKKGGGMAPPKIDMTIKGVKGIERPEYHERFPGVGGSDPVDATIQDATEEDDDIGRLSRTAEQLGSLRERLSTRRRMI